MLKLTKKMQEELNILIEIESEFINSFFEKNTFLGRVATRNSIDSFIKGYLEKKYDKVVPQLSTEYRYFIINLLINIKKEYKEFAFQELLMPSRTRSDEELVSLLKEEKEK